MSSVEKNYFTNTTKLGNKNKNLISSSNHASRGNENEFHLSLKLKIPN